MMRSTRAGGALLTRFSSRSFAAPRRCFAVSAVAKADILTDLYLKELQKYKVPTPKESDAEGHVQTFKAPSAPSSPEETNLSGEMQEYENQKVEIEGQAASGEETQSTEGDYFEDLKEPEGGAASHH